MGFYIEDRQGETKEEFLSRHGHMIKESDAKGLLQSASYLPVCIADNGGWTIAVICYSEQEVDRIVLGMDGRGNSWWAVAPEKLYEVCPEARDAVAIDAAGLSGA